MSGNATIHITVDIQIFAVLAKKMPLISAFIAAIKMLSDLEPKC